MASKIIVDQVQKSGLTALTLPTGNASASEFLQNDGAGALSWASASAGFAGIHTDVSSGSETYTVPTDITKLLVIITGGGGGGANGVLATENGTGGGAAGTVIASVTVVATDTITIAIGAGGSAGSAGGNSTFTHASGSGSFDTITAPGGVVGVLGSSPAVPTAPPTVGASNDGIAIKGGWPGLWVANGEYGGDSFWGGGGMSPYLNNTAGKSADAFGAGGSGGDHGASTSTAGSGGVGVCLIMEFK